MSKHSFRRRTLGVRATIIIALGWALGATHIRASLDLLPVPRRPSPVARLTRNPEPKPASLSELALDAEITA